MTKKTESKTANFDNLINIQVQNYLRNRRPKPSLKKRQFIDYRKKLQAEFPRTRKNPYAFEKSQMEYQFQVLKRRFNLTRDEFKTYYTNVRRANKKYYNIQRNNDALFQPYFSTDVSMITNRETFTRYQKALKFALSKEFKQTQNRLFRDRLYQNLSYFYGKDADNIIQIFDTYSDADLYQFFRENPDIDFVMYDSDQQAVATTLRTIIQTADQFIKTRIQQK